MSFNAEKWARNHRVGNSRAKSVLIELAHCFNDKTGVCCPSVDYLSEITELKRDTVISATKFLVEKGFIKKNTIKTKLGRGIQYELMGYSPKQDYPENGTTHSPENGITHAYEDSPKNGTMGYSQKRDDPENGDNPENGIKGSPENGTTHSPENGTVTRNKNKEKNKEYSIGAFSPISVENDTDHKKAKNVRGSQLTIETLPEQWINEAERIAPDIDPQKFFEDFRDYWTAVPGAKGRKKDWLATWRNALRNIPAWKRPNFQKQAATIAAPEVEGLFPSTPKPQKRELTHETITDKQAGFFASRLVTDQACCSRFGKGCTTNEAFIERIKSALRTEQGFNNYRPFLEKHGFL